MLSITLLSCSQNISPGREVISPLSETEMAIPDGRYQANFDMYHSAQVDFPPPSEKPSVIWVKTTMEDPRRWLTVVGDSEGGCVFSWNPNKKFEDNVTRLAPGGNVAWTYMNLHPANAQRSVTAPGLVTEGAILFHQFAVNSAANEQWLVIDCIDLEGNLRWRSEKVPGQYTNDDLFRLPGNKVALISYPDTLYVFNLENGELEKELSFDGYPTLYSSPPLPTPDGGFVHVGGKHGLDDEDITIVKYSQDFEEIWHATIENVFSVLNSSISSDGNLLVSVNFRKQSAGEPRITRLFSYDISDGSVKWSREVGLTIILGNTKDGNFLVHSASDQHTESLLLLNPGGDEIWSLDLSNRSWNLYSLPVIYTDSSILYGHDEGITLINPDGTIKWELTKNELGFEHDSDLDHWTLYPYADDSFIAAVLDRENETEYIMKLGLDD